MPIDQDDDRWAHWDPCKWPYFTCEELQSEHDGMMGVIAKDEVDNEDAGGVFELNEWV